MGNKRKLRDEEDARIAKKIQKLERKLKRRKRVISSDDSDSESEAARPSPPDSPALEPSPAPKASPYDHDDPIFDIPGLISPLPQTSQRDQPSLELTGLDAGLPKPGPSNAPDITSESLNQEDDQLEETILQILGEAPQPDMALGNNIHKDIASRWQDILLKGLTKEVKESILKKYLIPANCFFLVAPTLNPEAKAAVPDILSKRDATLMQKQNQIGIALAALSQLTEMILRNETSKQVLLQPLSDACRILCDSHNIESKTRRSIIMSSTNQSLREALASTNRDKYLFGEDLAEKLKIAKSVQKTGESLVKINPVTFSGKVPNPRNTTKSRNLNSRGPIQRKPPNRASEATRGRAPARQTRTTTYSRPPPPPPSKMTSPTRRSYRR